MLQASFRKRLVAQPTLVLLMAALVMACPVIAHATTTQELAQLFRTYECADTCPASTPLPQALLAIAQGLNKTGHPEQALPLALQAARYSPIMDPKIEQFIRQQRQKLGLN